jgi:hypothetical protein
MTYRGVVKQGKIELQPPAELPDGTIVRIEPEPDEWLTRLRELGKEIAKSTPPGASILNELITSRR